MVKWLKEQPKWLQIVLALPGLDIVWWVWRLLLSVEKKNTLGTVLAIVLLVVGLPFAWLIDIITLLLQDKVLWFDN